MADRSYTVNAPSSAQPQVVAIDVNDGAGNPVHGLDQWGYGTPVTTGGTPDSPGVPTGRVEWGWWEYQWLGEPDATHDHYGWQTLAAVQALNPTNDPTGVVVTWEDVG